MQGNINPDVPPLTEKQNVFNTPTGHHGSEDRTESEPEVLDEKAGKSQFGVMEDEMDENPVIDPFVPFDDLPDEPHFVVTIRAIFVGCVCGALVNASNLYLGLKTGWTFGANLFGAIVGFAVIKAISRALPNKFPILGGSFGPRENNIVQTAAAASGGLSSVFISGIPALYQLELLTTPDKDFPRLITLTIVGGYFGFLFATPLRKFFIIYVARELKLVFPTPSATAMTIRSMHAAATGEAVAKMKMAALGWAFSAALILRVVSQYALGILWDWHIFTWFFIWGKHKNQALAVENWGWLIEWTPAFIGVGILVGLNTAISFFMGSVLAWGIIGPALVHQKIAFGKDFFEPGDDGYEKWGGLVNFAGMTGSAASKETPSPRFWLLWPGVLLMIVVSFVELGLQYKVFYFVSKAIWRASCEGLKTCAGWMGKKSAFLEKHSHMEESHLVEDPALPADQVKTWMWLPGIIVVIICSCVVMGVQVRSEVVEIHT